MQRCVRIGSWVRGKRLLRHVVVYFPAGVLANVELVCKKGLLFTILMISNPPLSRCPALSSRPNASHSAHGFRTARDFRLFYLYNGTGASVPSAPCKLSHIPWSSACERLYEDYRSLSGKPARAMSFHGADTERLVRGNGAFFLLPL